MGILTKFALVTGGLVFFIIVFIVCLAFIDCLESGNEKVAIHGRRRRSMS